MNTANSIGDEKLRQRGLCEIALIQARDGAFTQAREIFDAARVDPSSVDNTFNSDQPLRCYQYFAQAMAFMGDIRSAMNMANNQKSYNKNSMLTMIAKGQAEAGNILGSMNTLGAMNSTNDFLDTFERNHALREIAIAQAEAGDMKGALATVTDITNANDRNYVLGEIATAQERAGDVASAIDTVSKASDENWRLNYAASAIASGQAKAGDFEGALDRVWVWYGKSKSLI